MQQDFVNLSIGRPVTPVRLSVCDELGRRGIVISEQMDSAVLLRFENQGLNSSLRFDTAGLQVELEFGREIWSKKFSAKKLYCVDSQDWRLEKATLDSGILKLHLRYIGYQQELAVGERLYLRLRGVTPFLRTDIKQIQVVGRLHQLNDREGEPIDIEARDIVELINHRGQQKIPLVAFVDGVARVHGEREGESLSIIIEHTAPGDVMMKVNRLAVRIKTGEDSHYLIRDDHGVTSLIHYQDQYRKQTSSDNNKRAYAGQASELCLVLLEDVVASLGMIAIDLGQLNTAKTGRSNVIIDYDIEGYWPGHLVVPIEKEPYIGGELSGSVVIKEVSHLLGQDSQPTMGSLIKAVILMQQALIDSEEKHRKLLERVDAIPPEPHLYKDMLVHESPDHTQNTHIGWELKALERSKYGWRVRHSIDVSFEGIVEHLNLLSSVVLGQQRKVFWSICLREDVSPAYQAFLGKENWLTGFVAINDATRKLSNDWKPQYDWSVDAIRQRLFNERNVVSAMVSVWASSSEGNFPAESVPIVGDDYLDDPKNFPSGKGKAVLYSGDRYLGEGKRDARHNGLHVVWHKGDRRRVTIQVHSNFESWVQGRTIHSYISGYR